MSKHGCCFKCFQNWVNFWPCFGSKVFCTVMLSYQMTLWGICGFFMHLYIKKVRIFAWITAAKLYVPLIAFLKSMAAIGMLNNNNPSE